MEGIIFDQFYQSIRAYTRDTTVYWYFVPYTESLRDVIFSNVKDKHIKISKDYSRNKIKKIIFSF